MGTRVRRIIEWNEVEYLFDFDIQRAFLNTYQVVMGDSIYGKKIQLKLLSEPIISNNITYIFTTDDISHYDERDSYQRKFGKNPIFTEKGVCINSNTDYNLYLIQTKLEKFEYETT